MQAPLKGIHPDLHKIFSQGPVRGFHKDLCKIFLQGPLQDLGTRLFCRSENSHKDLYKIMQGPLGGFHLQLDLDKIFLQPPDFLEHNTMCTHVHKTSSFTSLPDLPFITDTHQTAAALFWTLGF